MNLLILIAFFAGIFMLIVSIALTIYLWDKSRNFSILIGLLALIGICVYCSVGAYFSFRIFKSGSLPFTLWEKSTGAPETASAEDLSGLRTSGMVEDNYDGGDAVMGNIIMITRDDPQTDPSLFLVAGGYSIDIEYVGKMYFTNDAFNGGVTPDQAAQLALKLYPQEKALRIWVGPEPLTPKGFTYWKKASGWWILKDWKFSASPIQPKGLVATEAIFVSTTQKERDLVAGNGVIYGQFWTPKNPGYIVHFQVRQGETLSVPAGWQGTYWLWTGDFKIGEMDLQKRLIQATSLEVVDRDDILGVQLLIVGNLPELDPEITSFDFKETTVTWQTRVAGWTK